MEKIGNHWDEVLSGEYARPYFAKLSAAVDAEYSAFRVFPPKDLIFRALRMVDYPDVKAVILGQDPYHGEGQANGIAFAVGNGIPLPPSLVNIYKEIENDLGVTMPPTGTLVGWEKQGVLLLNTTLTVRKGQPQSHAGLGWQIFTDAVIAACSARPEPLCFMLWGSNALSKRDCIDGRHLVLTAPHPSPLSAFRGFFGCKHFSKANAFLVQNGYAPIDWCDVDGRERAAYYQSADKIHRV